ncbi:hypothetical protein EBR25_13425 [bacterium]|jgi:NADP-dependent 3-hydroxy acid dehydrogenase YdfG|nr:hypothetical protein [bacterium]
MSAVYYGKNRDGSLKTKEQVLEAELRSANRAIERIKRNEAQLTELQAKIDALKWKIAWDVHDLKQANEMIQALEKM